LAEVEFSCISDSR